MIGTVDSSRRARPLLALSLLAGAAFVAGVGWITWRGLEERPRPSGAALLAPPVPAGQLLMTAAPVPAPSIDLPAAGGGSVSLAASRGQVVVVNFWASWCQACVQELPSLVALAREGSASHPRRLRVVAVSVDEAPGAAERFFAISSFGGQPDGLIVALDPGGSGAARAFSCTGRGACRAEDLRLPETYIVDREGRIAAFVVGAIDWTTPAVRRLLEPLLGE